MQSTKKLTAQKCAYYKYVKSFNDFEKLQKEIRQPRTRGGVFVIHYVDKNGRKRYQEAYASFFKSKELAEHLERMYDYEIVCLRYKKTRVCYR